jgi:hypothetical protein
MAVQLFADKDPAHATRYADLAQGQIFPCSRIFGLFG